MSDQINLEALIKQHQETVAALDKELADKATGTDLGLQDPGLQPLVDQRNKAYAALSAAAREHEAARNAPPTDL